MLVNALAADEKYPVSIRDNLMIPIQRQLAQREKNFSELFSAFLKCRFNSKHFEKKDVPHRFCIPEITDFENVVR